MFVRTTRTFMALAMVLAVTACASKDKDAAGVGMDGSTGTMTGPLDGTQVTDGGYYGGQGAAPGTQQDLVVNVGDRVFFAYDSSSVESEGQRTLQMQAEWLKRYPNVNVTIAGHCDERGTREYNLALGDRRAAAVKNYLVSLGVPAERINTISYGKERPAVTGSDPAAWAQNRRSVTEVN